MNKWFVMLLFCAGMLMAQSTIEVVKVSGGSESIDIALISKITFTATDMVVAGAGKTYAIADVKLLIFHDSGIPIRAEEGSAAPVVQFESLVPNPFNPVTRLRFGLAAKARICVSVFSPKGEQIAVLADRAFAAGFYELPWNGLDSKGRRAASGTYILRILADGQIIQKQAVLVK